jgi:hypothetical protein
MERIHAIVGSQPETGIFDIRFDFSAISRDRHGTTGW